MPLTTSSTNGRATTGAKYAANTSKTAATVAIAEPPVRSQQDSAHGGTDAARRKARSIAKQQQAAERIASATGQVSAQNAQAVEVSRQLRESVQEISAGSEEASGATQESLAVMGRVEERIQRQQQAAANVEEISRTLQTTIADTTVGIERLLQNVSGASDRQAASVKVISELEKQADEIGEIVKTVAQIADQTNLLALNAAIEAARARQHGKGFAVVADEVRTLAETSERSAKQIRDLIDEIRVGVNAVAADVQASAESGLSEVEKGKGLTIQLGQIRDDMTVLMKGAVEVADAASQGEKGAAQAKAHSEEIAAASEQQSAACEESLQTITEQGAALGQSEKVAHDLAEIADELRTSTDIAKSAEEVAQAAEELGSAVEEINRAAAQISVAIGQISSGAQIAAAKSQEAASAVNQIEQGARLSETNSTAAIERADLLLSLVATNKVETDTMIETIASTTQSGMESVRKIVELELVSRRIDKIVDAIANVSMQTNMLAINGSVESARAGEFGKGFAVVSTDIRNLARDSAENADRIKDLVKAVQDRIVQVRGELEETTRQALVEVEAAKSTSARLVEIERDMAEVRSGNAVVRESAQEIAAALAQVKTGLDQISSAAAQSDQLSGQAAAAAKQQAQAAENMAAAVEEIAALADELQNA